MKWDDYGESSLTLLAVHCNMDKKDPGIPRDPSDFRRCMHLFECLDFDRFQIKELLIVTAHKYPMWKPFVEKWEKLIGLYEEEKDNKSAPKLFTALQRC